MRTQRPFLNTRRWQVIIWPLYASVWFHWIGPWPGQQSSRPGCVYSHRFMVGPVEFRRLTLRRKR